ncbi:MAG: biotin/lipoyl-binding protein [Oscillospiraceae bacterium]|nr:biotin/lipoyl-binding protein [Oscillospiraceae bacterium]
MRKGVKVALISTVSVIVAGAILVGALWYFGRQTDPVQVVPLMYHSATFYDDMMNFDGRVTAENLQSVYASDTQTVTEIFVSEGDEVKKGDPLLSYDTTLTEIELERKRIDVQQAELDLKNAKDDLAWINSLKPYTPPPPTQPPQPTEESLEPIEELPLLIGGEGTQEMPYRWVWSDEVSYDEAFITGMFGEENEVWISFEEREQNSLDGAITKLWGLHVVRDEEGKLKYSFFTPVLPPDDEIEPEPEPIWIDDSSGYTASEIAKMRAEKQTEIRDLDVAYRIAQVEYERMKSEAESGIVYAKVDGTILTRNDPELARMDGSPVLLLSGGGCYHVTASIGEYDRDRFQIGDEVIVMSWMSGGEIVGTLEAVDDTPVSGYYYGNGNPNVSLYPATIAVDAQSGLQENEYVSVRFASNGAQDNALYLENMYIRSENGRSYVYKRGADGLLQKVPVETGAVLWGSYTAVYGDLTADDWIAFPYGKSVREGAQTVEAEDSVYYYYG